MKGAVERAFYFRVKRNPSLYIETDVQKSALETATIRPSDSNFKPKMQCGRLTYLKCDYVGKTDRAVKSWRSKRAIPASSVDGCARTDVN